MGRRGPIVGALALLALSACGRTGQSSGSSGSAEESWPISCEGDRECDDGLVCSGQERCVDHRCVAGLPPECDDGDATTEDVCLEPWGCAWVGPDGVVEPAAGGAAGGDYRGRVPQECAGSLVEKDVNVTSPKTVNALIGVRCIDGDLRISGPLIDSLSSLGELRWVSGDISITDAPELEDLEGVDRLEKVGGSLEIARLPHALDIAPFPSLREVSFDLTIAEFEGLERLAGFEALVHVGGDFTIRDAERLRDIHALALHLEEIEGSLLLTGLSKLEQWHGFDELRRVGSELRIDAAPTMSLSGFSSLEEIGWKLTLPDTLVSLTGFDRLKAISSLSLELPELEHFDAFSALEDAGFELSLSAPRLETLHGFDSLRSVGKLTLSDMEDLRWVAGFSNLEDVGSLIVHGTALKELPFSGLKNLEEIHLSENLLLESLNDVSAVEGLVEIRVKRNPELRSLAALGRVESLDVVRIEENLRLSELGWPHLAAISESLMVVANPQLSRCEVDALVAVHRGPPPNVCCNRGCEQCGGGLCIEQGSVTAGQSGKISLIRCDGVDLGVFAHVVEADRVELKNYDEMPMRLPHLAQVSGDLIVSEFGWHDLTIFSALESVGGNFDIFTGRNIEDMSGLDNLETIGGRLNISSSDNLSILSIPSLVDVGTMVRAWGNDALNKCQLEALMDQLASHGSTPELVSIFNVECAGVCEEGVCQ